MVERSKPARVTHSVPYAEIPAKSLVVGTPISMTSYGEVLRLIDSRPRDQATVVAVCNVHSVMTARRNPAVAQALRSATVATPDGMPLVWVLRATANRGQRRVYGPDLMRAALPYGTDRGWRHYLFGGTSERLERLRGAIQNIAPGANIVGAYAPPFRPLTGDEERTVIADIVRTRADVVWVGIGMPKQELWMDSVRDRLPGTALIGVGAAFDLLSGTVRPAPAWMQRVGLEWLYRLTQEPRRLWRRYLWNNPAFALLALRQVVAHWRGKGDSH